MKKYVAFSAVATTVFLFALTAQPESVTSSTAMSLDQMNEVQSEVLRIQTQQNIMPTMPPFPSIEVRIPEFRQNRPLTITVTPFPRPTSTTNTQNPTPSPTASPTTSSTPKPSTRSTPRQTSQPTLSPVSIATITPTPTAKPANTPSAKPATPAPTTVQSSSMTDEVIRLVNAERAKVNLGALTKNSNLTNSAQKYAEYMANANFFSHNGPDGSTFITRNKAAGYTNYRWMGENIAAGQGSAQQVMNDWMNSSGHKANILNAKAKEIGVGYASNNNATYKKYWVQEFGAR